MKGFGEELRVTKVEWSGELGLQASVQIAVIPRSSGSHAQLKEIRYAQRDFKASPYRLMKPELHDTRQLWSRVVVGELKERSRLQSRVAASGLL